MARNRVMVEMDPATKRVIRILKKDGEALFMPPEKIAQWPKIEAEREIKNQLLVIQNNECVDCGKPINMSSHLHERQTRGKGGTPGLHNSDVLCADCHLNLEHGKRKPQWARLTNR